MKQNEEAKGIEDIIFNVLLLVAIDLIQYVAKIDKKFQYKDNIANIQLRILVKHTSTSYDLNLLFDNFSNPIYHTILSDNMCFWEISKQLSGKKCHFHTRLIERSYNLCKCLRLTDRVSV